MKNEKTQNLYTKGGCFPTRPTTIINVDVDIEMILKIREKENLYRITILRLRAGRKA